MNNPIALTLVAGLLFGTWPLLMQKSGLSGHLSSAVFALVAFLIILVPTFLKGKIAEQVEVADLKIAILAGVLGGLGLLAFNTMMTKVPMTSIGTYIVVMIVAQTIVPVIYQMVVSGDFSLRKIAGALIAITGVILLAK